MPSNLDNEQKMDLVIRAVTDIADGDEGEAVMVAAELLAIMMENADMAQIELESTDDAPGFFAALEVPEEEIQPDANRVLH